MKAVIAPVTYTQVAKYFRNALWVLGTIWPANLHLTFAPFSHLLSDDELTKSRGEPLWLLAVASFETKRNVVSSDGSLMV